MARLIVRICNRRVDRIASIRAAVWSRSRQVQKQKIAAVFFCMASSVPALADGEFYQADYASGGSSMVGSIVRGPVGASIGWSEFDDGSAVSANFTYGLPVTGLGDGATLRLGPTARLDDAGTLDLGAKAVFERWSPTDWGSIFVLADFNTILNEYLLLAELSHANSGLSGSLAIQGGDNGFREQTFVLGYSIPQTPLGLRLGYRVRARQVVVGMTINTF